MRAFLVLALVAYCHARPEAGYNYPQPSGLGSNIISSGSNLGSSFGGINQFSSGGSSFLGSASHGSSLGINSGFSQGINSGFSQGINTGFSQGINTGFSQGISSSSSGSSQGFGFAQGPALAPIIQKHIYVHVPPPEPIEEQQRQILQAPQIRKNYKIIFIKAPSAPAISPAVIQQQIQNQEKTLVYVLVKKPDEPQDILLDAIAPTKPSKPEVYFIKYKTQRKPEASLISSGSGSSQVSESLGISQSIGSGINQISQSSFSSGIGIGAPVYGPPPRG